MRAERNDFAKRSRRNLGRGGGGGPRWLDRGAGMREPPGGCPAEEGFPEQTVGWLFNIVCCGLRNADSLPKLSGGSHYNAHYNVT